MLDTQRKKLEGKEGRYISIGITDGGEPYNMIGVPWERTGTAFSMRIPDVYIAPEDLADEELMELLSRYTVMGCYIWSPLEDYGFLARFPDIRDLNIKFCRNMTDLEFLRPLTNCYMLSLHGAELENLDVILDMHAEHKNHLGGFSNVALSECTVRDLSGFESKRHCFHEFIVCGYEDEVTRNRWRVVNAGIRKYYDLSRDD